MITFLSPGLVRGAVVLLAAAAALGVTVPASADTGAKPALAVSDLAFEQSHVDASAGGAAVSLDWTITDSNPQAVTVGGTVTIRMRDHTGAYIGRNIDVDYSFGNDCCGLAEFVSGTVAKSKYTWSFPVPQYAGDTSVTWVVTQVTVSDGVSAPVTVSGPAMDDYDGTLTAKEQVDSTPPSLSNVTLINRGTYQRPYAYVEGTTAEVGYAYWVQDWQSGFWKTSLTFSGPGGQSVTSEAAYSSSGGCGMYYGGDDHDVYCGVPVTLPTGAAAGTWKVTSITVTDNAGNAATTATPDAPSVTVTSNAAVQAGDFSAAPNPANNWAGAATVQVSMAVTGADQGVSAIYVDSDWCYQGSTTPTTNTDGTLSVPVRFLRGTASCRITGIAVVDVGGNVALYGSEYGAPDPHLTITRVPDTTPPVATTATLSPTSLPASTASGSWITLTIQVAPSIAPVNAVELVVYDSTGAVVTQQFGGTSESADGTVRVYFMLPYGTRAGTYTVGFRITDAGGLSTAYDIPTYPNSQPAPSGPLVLTVTSS
jgi:hypothetical protein